jgi:hypothetical protein
MEIEISEGCRNYFNKELGFSKRKIRKAWDIVRKDFPHYDQTVTEILTRDLLRNPKLYESTKKNTHFSERLKSY